MELQRGRCKRPLRSARRYLAGDWSPLKRESTTVSSRCSLRKARSASCTRARCGRFSAARARRRRRGAPWSLRLSAVEAELRLLLVESVPLGSEDEPDGLCSLFVVEEGPDDRATCHVARGADGAAPDEIRSSASAPRAPAASATAETVCDGWRPQTGRTPPRRHPHPGTTSRMCPIRSPEQPFRPRSPTAAKAPGPPRAPRRRPHCAPVPGFHPRLR